MTTTRSFVGVVPAPRDASEIVPERVQAGAAPPAEARENGARENGAREGGARDDGQPADGERGSHGERDSHDEARLLAASAAGDAQAFTRVYQRWQGPIYRFTLHMAGSESLAEDVTQEVFVTLAQEGDRFDPARGRFSSYVFAIARNLLRRRLRREGLYESIDGEAEPGGGGGGSGGGGTGWSRSLSASRGGGTGTGAASSGDGAGGRAAEDPASDPDRAFDRREAIQRVRRAVCALPVTFREAVVLCDLQELSYAEAAAVLGCPIGTVRSRLHRGRLLLAERLGAEPDGTQGETVKDTRKGTRGGGP